MNHYRVIVYGHHSKLECLVCLRKCVCPRQKTLAYYKICPFPVNYESVMLYSTGLEAAFDL
jgi:hypothetical protein